MKYGDEREIHEECDGEWIFWMTCLSNLNDNIEDFWMKYKKDKWKILRKFLNDDIVGYHRALLNDDMMWKIDSWIMIIGWYV